MQYTTSLARRARSLLSAAIALLIVCGLPASPARADNYANIGAWSITYSDVNNVHVCSAIAKIDDTVIGFALVQSSSDIQWQIYLVNSAWANAMRNSSTLVLLLVTDSQTWRAQFAVSDDKKILALTDVSAEFVESVAATRSLGILDENRHAMIRTPLTMRGSRDALTTVIQCLRDHPLPNSAPPPSSAAPPSSAPPQEQTVLYTGTGFFVAPGQLVTASHVVADCTGPIYVRYPNRNASKATVSAQDETNDLALLGTEMSNLAAASFRVSPRLGDAVATFGFPYADILAAEGSFTLGNISSLSGIGNDTRFLQFSAPVQPGNSGGPLLDMSGNVIGVIVARLDALAVMKSRGSVPENVNFAIHGMLVTNFLSIKGVTAVIDTSNPPRNLAPPEVADAAKKFTVQIYCEGSEKK